MYHYNCIYIEVLYNHTINFFQLLTSYFIYTFYKISYKDGPSCEDCKKCLNEEDDDVSNIPPGGALLCARCSSRRSERKETIQEIVDSEVSYGKDMKVIKEVGSEKLFFSNF